MPKIHIYICAVWFKLSVKLYVYSFGMFRMCNVLPRALIEIL
jgi:hypothetical protein